MLKAFAGLLLTVVTFVPAAFGAGVCQGFGPQTPRDIDQKTGTNTQLFSFAPDFRTLNLCNIHFHKHAEHKAADFSRVADDGDAGFRCKATADLSQAELAAPAENACHEVQPGDTIEVHWVYSSCDVAPGSGLDACVSETCGNPDLRVETQVFLVVNDRSAGDFRSYDYGGVVDGYHQAKSLPTGTGEPVTFLGSTTGSDFDNAACSPFQVSWSVRPRCAKIDLAGLSRWCARNIFLERGAHGVRPLVVAPELLSPID